jgi:hypothetical protein
MYKIKNHYCLWGACLLVAGMLSSCAKELNQVPQSTANQGAVFGSDQGLQLYEQSFYGDLPGVMNDSETYKIDANLSDYGAQSTCPTYLLQNAFSSRIENSSVWNWTPLRNINYFIQGVETSPVQDKANWLGLARFFRAYFYFGMVQEFGNVPWINTPLNVNDTALLYGPRSPRTLIIDSVIADLQYAAANITMMADPTCTQVTKYTAYGLLSRVALYEGTFEKYQTSYGLEGNSNAFLQQAVAAAQAVIDSGGFSLYTGGGVNPNGSYRALFNSNSPIAQETMLGIASSQSLAVLNDANWWFSSATYGVRFSFIRTFINTYLNSDGTPFTSVPGYDTMTFMHEMQNRDGRLQQTIMTPGYTRTNNGVTVASPPVFSYTYTGYQPIKWLLQDESYDAAQLGTNFLPIMRYAEILLNYAEARAELGQLTASDWTMTVGALRARAGITGGLNTLPTTLDPYMQANYFPDVTNPALMEIRRERGIELTLEGFRFNDLARWNHGELLTRTWDGMYVPALDQPMDLNGDGIPDVCFYETTLPSPTISTVTYINVAPTISSGTNPQTLVNGSSGELNWLNNIPRTWQSYMYLYPIPYSELLLNPNLGQNPGWQ